MATADSVKEVMAPGGDYDLDEANSLTVFIRMGNALAARVATCSADTDFPLSSDEQTDLASLLAAHFYKCSDQQKSDEKIEVSQVAYRGMKDGEGLKATLYGQAALTLDPSGCLASIAGGRPTAEILWLGKVESEQIDWEDRN